MKKLLLLVLVLAFNSLIAQNNALDAWSIGAGFNNSLMHGDLRSTYNVDALDDIDLNIGYYAYLDRMITPAFGFELKGHYGQMSGGAFELSNAYTVGGGGAYSLGETRFEATTYGAQVNLILNLSSFMRKPNATKARKWNFATYAGLGWHTYDSRLYAIATDELLVDYGINASSDGHANSLYFTTAASLKYKINNNFDIELRQDINLNEDDILDGARSDKQLFDMFMNTSLGVIFKLNKKEADNYAWLDKDSYDAVEDENLIDFADDDGDGVINQYDKDPNTPAGALVYGNGVPVDTDRDGFPDYKDPCPIKYSTTNRGCPIDTDKDGVFDDVDLCPKEPGNRSRLGCPKPKDTVENQDLNIIDEGIISVEPIYFDINVSDFKAEYNELISKVALTLFQNPEINIILEGHADVQGDDVYNQDLSDNRVKSVRKALEARGIDGSRIISATGYGEANPTFSNENDASNRRVDIIFIKK